MLVCATATIAQSVLRKMPATASIDGGIGAVNLGVPLIEGGTSPRIAWTYPWREVDIDRMRALILRYGVQATVQVLEALPADWQYPT